MVESKATNKAQEKAEDDVIAARAEQSRQGEPVPAPMIDGHDPILQEQYRKDKKLNAAIEETAGSDNVPPHVTENERVAARIADAEKRRAKAEKK